MAVLDPDQSWTVQSLVAGLNQLDSLSDYWPPGSSAHNQEGYQLQAALYGASLEQKEALIDLLNRKTWEDRALEAGWVAPEKPEVSFKRILMVGDHEVVLWGGYGAVVPSLGITEGDFEKAATLIVAHHTWMPTQYPIVDPAITADWTSVASVQEALVDVYHLTDW